MGNWLEKKIVKKGILFYISDKDSKILLLLNCD